MAISKLGCTPQGWEIAIVKEYGNLPSVECYPGLLNQAFMNILANAIDALEESTREASPSISIRTRLEDGRAVIEIADSGPGMAEKVRDRIFDPFFTTKPVGKDTGLGLSVSYQIIVDRHNGQVECISDLGTGTRFVISIPVSKISS